MNFWKVFGVGCAILAMYLIFIVSAGYINAQPADATQSGMFYNELVKLPNGGETFWRVTGITNDDNTKSCGIVQDYKDGSMTIFSINLETKEVAFIVHNTSWKLNTAIDVGKLSVVLKVDQKAEAFEVFFKMIDEKTIAVFGLSFEDLIVIMQHDMIVVRDIPLNSESTAEISLKNLADTIGNLVKCAEAGGIKTDEKA